MNKKLASLAAGILATMMLFTSCGGGQKTTDTSKKDVAEVIKATDPTKLPEVSKNRKDTLIVGTTAPSGKFNPIYSDSVYDSWVVSLVFDGLISNDEQGNPTPLIAKEWKISEDGKTYTFTLNKGVKFSDGQELTAEDVAFTFTAICDPSYDGPRTDAVSSLVGYKEYNEDKEGKVKEVAGIKVVDKYTISFTLTEPKAPAIYDFGYGIMPKHVYNFEKGNIKPLKDKFLEPVGAGPYLFKNYKAGQEIVFEKNKNYWRGEPKIANIIMKVTNANTVIQELTTGSVDIDRVASKPEQLDLVKKAEFLDIYSYPANSYGYIGWNLRDEKFKDKKVRQALVYGLNRAGFVQAYFKGLGEVCNAPVSKVSWAYTDEVNKYEYDVEKANKLLDEAGWVKKEDGYRYKDGKKFTVHWMTYTGSKYVEALTPILIENWKQIGVEVIPELMEFGTLAQKVYDEQKFEMYNMAWSLSIDPDPSGIFSIEQDKLGGFNSVGWRNEESEKLIKEGLNETDMNKRKEIYQKWVKLANEELPYIFLTYSKDNYAVSAKVKGARLSPFTDWTYDIHKVELAEVAK